MLVSRPAHDPRPDPRFEAWPHRLSGTVIAALLNHRPQLAALGDAVHAAPYQAPPRAPVLALRPRHMLAGEGATIEVPAAVEVGASLGIVIGRSACRGAAADAMHPLAG
ncbi:MAG: fumarylacetoacetate hydrolase family protein [Burkholderiales bacterium]|nr:fumarylacetoacetate hydrolase family protein [Burkholderiales bacterium]